MMPSYVCIYLFNVIIINVRLFYFDFSGPKFCKMNMSKYLSFKIPILMVYLPVCI